MKAAPDITSRLKFLRCFRTAGASLAVILLGCLLLLRMFLYGSADAQSRTFWGAAFIVLLLPVGFEWTADAFFDRDEFQLTDKLFALLPYLYSSVLVCAAGFGLLFFQRGLISESERTLFSGVYFAWLCPPEFPQLRAVIGIVIGAACGAIWWPSSNNAYLDLAIMSIATPFIRLDFRDTSAKSDEAR